MKHQCLVLCGWMGLWVGLGTGCGKPEPPPALQLEPQPAHILDVLALQPTEWPSGYTLIEDADLLALAGVRENPGYVRREADRMIYTKAGAEAAWLGLYGPGNEVHLLLMGLYFRDSAAAQVYLDAQQTRERPVAGYRLATEAGAWYLFFAMEPDLAFTEEEREEIRASCNRYAQRLEMERLFDHMDRLR